MPALLMSMDVLLAPMILLASTAGADASAGVSAGPRAGARATVSARIIRGEAVALESSDPIYRALRNSRDDLILILPKARDRKAAKTGQDPAQVLIEFY